MADSDPFEHFPHTLKEAEAAIMKCLFAKHDGEPFDEDLLFYAVNLLTVYWVASQDGIELETAITLVQQVQAKGDISVKWSSETGLEIDMGAGVKADDNG